MEISDIQQEIKNVFGGKIRVRVCGLLIKNNSILLVKHHNLGKTGELWSPPGGGMNFTESAKTTLQREFYEETGIIVEVGDLISVTEYLEEPLHAIELFFGVSYVEGAVKTGFDPELSKENQIIQLVEFVPFPVLAEMSNDILHKVLHGADSEFHFEKISGKYLTNREI